MPNGLVKKLVNRKIQVALKMPIEINQIRQFHMRPNAIDTARVDAMVNAAINLPDPRGIPTRPIDESLFESTMSNGPWKMEIPAAEKGRLRLTNISSKDPDDPSRDNFILPRSTALISSSERIPRNKHSGTINR